jgi:hypothetical protein
VRVSYYIFTFVLPQKVYSCSNLATEITSTRCPWRRRMHRGEGYMEAASVSRVIFSHRRLKTFDNKASTSITPGASAPCCRGRRCGGTAPCGTQRKGSCSSPRAGSQSQCSSEAPCTASSCGVGAAERARPLGVGVDAFGELEVFVRDANSQHEIHPHAVTHGLMRHGRVGLLKHLVE